MYRPAYEVDDSDDDIEEPEAALVLEEEEDEIIESDIELEGDVVEPDNDPPQKMGDSSVEVSEENRDAAQEAKGKAMEAISEGNLEEAIEHLTEAILLNPASAIMYGTRATVYIKMKKPNAAIRDADAALKSLGWSLTFRSSCRILNSSLSSNISQPPTFALQPTALLNTIDLDMN